jgi:hypothetical protein
MDGGAPVEIETLGRYSHGNRCNYVSTSIPWLLPFFEHHHPASTAKTQHKSSDTHLKLNRTIFIFTSIVSIEETAMHFQA